MPWRETLEPTRMQRVAVVAPKDQLRPVLLALASQGCVEPELLPSSSTETEAALQRVQTVTSGTAPMPEIVRDAPDIATLERTKDAAALAGEVALEKVDASMIRDGAVAALAGWTPLSEFDRLEQALAPEGAAVVCLRAPRGVQPPTALHGTVSSRAFQPLVNTYGTVPYADLNPSVIAGVAYVLMFGMMFGDAGHGFLLLVLGCLTAWGPKKWLTSLRKYRWASPFLIGAGIASMGFGFAFGEAFGPTGLVPTLWLRPLDHATTLLAVSVAIGAGILAVSYALGAVNRFREGGIARSLVALSGIAGAALYLGLGIVGAGWYWHRTPVMLAGTVLALLALALGFVGLFAEAGGRASGALEAGVELFDGVLRLGTNTVSFARLAAFGLTHAALSSLVWSATADLWRRGGVGDIALAVIVFALGNALTFALEALVAGVQALRLEYYEIFSRVFTSEGREFQPWHVQVRQ
ncbi:MAG: V-type ATPase 116kDa subunit family protein [Acidimicrobiales bacterium]